ncbi:ead/Ea22-like family protein [Edwardsiella piscicida]|nr:ead/Ea22-like family protein [Edwardsiella piscicida]
MIQVDKQAMRSVAENATPGEWCTDECHGVIADAGLNANYYIASCSGPEHRANARYIAAANPSTMLALLDENEELEKRVAELAVENAALKNYQPSPTSAAVFEAIEITESLFDEGRPELAMIRAFNIMKMKRSPNTDAFINEMRAQGVEMLLNEEFRSSIAWALSNFDGMSEESLNQLIWSGQPPEPEGDVWCVEYMSRARDIQEEIRKFAKKMREGNA